LEKKKKTKRKLSDLLENPTNPYYSALSCAVVHKSVSFPHNFLETLRVRTVLERQNTVEITEGDFGGLARVPFGD
jgi:hypothetical protein